MTGRAAGPEVGGSGPTGGDAATAAGLPTAARIEGTSVRGRAALLGAAALICLPAVLALAEGAAFYASNRSNGFITVGGWRRGYVLHLPRARQHSGPMPLVISLHGAGLWGAAQRDISRWNDLADREGFAVVYPSGEGHAGPRVWAPEPGAPLLRDVEFLTRLMDTLVARYGVDPRRIYVNGLSNGGGMTAVLTCLAPFRVAAAGIVAGAMTHAAGLCDGAPPVPVAFIHGARDRLTPLAGGPTWVSPKPFPSIPDRARRWAERNGCDPAPRDSALSAATMRRTYAGCPDGADVVLYVLRNDGHVWPGGGPLPTWLVGPDARSMDASRVLWEFFRDRTRHAEPGTATRDGRAPAVLRRP